MKWVWKKIQKCCLKFKRLFPSKLFSGWREKNFQKYTSQNAIVKTKCPTRKKKLHNQKHVKKKFRKIFMLMAVLFLGNASFSSSLIDFFLFFALFLFFQFLKMLLFFNAEFPCLFFCLFSILFLFTAIIFIYTHFFLYNCSFSVPFSYG